MTEEVDFITTIACLKKIVKEAEAAMENPTHGHFLFIIPKLLRNTGGGGGFGQHEESYAHLVGEINLTREQLLKKGHKMSEIKLGDYADAPQYAPNNCTVIGIWEEKVWLLMPGGGTTVAPIDGIVLHRDKIKSKEPEVKNEPLGKIKAILARTYTGEVKFNLVAQYCERGEALREIREIIKQTEDN